MIPILKKQLLTSTICSLSSNVRMFDFFYRNSIRFESFIRESKSVEYSMTTPLTETALPTILNKYELKDLLNAGEFGLCFRCLRDKTFSLGFHKLSGGKKSKIRLTKMASANALTEKLKILHSTLIWSCTYYFLISLWNMPRGL